MAQVRTFVEDMGRHDPCLPGSFLHLVPQRLGGAVAIAAFIFFIGNDLFTNKSLHAVRDLQGAFGHSAVVDGKGHFW